MRGRNFEREGRIELELWGWEWVRISLGGWVRDGRVVRFFKETLWGKRVFGCF